MSASTRKGGAEGPPGVTPPTAAGGHAGFLSDVIVDLGFATRETVEQAVRAARSPGTTVARVLVDTGAITEEQLARATAERYGIDYIDLEGFDVDAAAAKLIKATAARRYQAVPVGFLGKGLLVAMADPADALGVNDIALMTKQEVRPAVAARPALDALLEALPLDDWGVEEEQSAKPAEQSAKPAEQPPEPKVEPASAAVFWQEGAGEELPAVSEPPAGPGDAARLGEELTALRGQLAGAEAKLHDKGKVEDEPPAASDGAELRARLAAAEEAGAELEKLREALAAAETGRTEGHERAREAESELRRIRAEGEVRSGELETLRKKLTDAETELVHVRAEVDTRGSELEAMRTRAESAEAESESALRRAEQSEGALAEAQGAAEQSGREVAEAQGAAEQAESETAEARRALAEAQGAAAEAADLREEAGRLTEELRAADARAEQARLALGELRDESEREREQWAMAERDLRQALAEEEIRRGALEERLSEVEGSAFAAERAFEELRVAQRRMRGALRALADPDARVPADED